MPIRASRTPRRAPGWDSPGTPPTPGPGGGGTFIHRTSPPFVTGPRQDIDQPSNAATWRLSDNDFSYSNIMRYLYEESAWRWDDVAKASYLSFATPKEIAHPSWATPPIRTTYVTYEDEQSIAAKGAYVRSQGLGGAIVWTISQGYLEWKTSGEKDPLMKAVKNAFLDGAPPTVTVTSPNGGETWSVGASQTITWSTTGAIASVKIDYSTDNGSSWIPVIASTANDGSHPWTVPNTPASTCRVRVSDAANAATSDTSNALFTIGAGGISPAISLNRGRLNFAKVGAAITSAQTLRLRNTGGGTLSWTATPSASWIVLDKTSGTGNARIQVSVNATGLGNGTYDGTISIGDPAATNTPQTVQIQLVVKNAGQNPFGTFETPAAGATGVTGNIAVTGWVLDDVEVASVKIYRSPLAGEGTARVFIGDANLVEGARPDVEALYATYPWSYRSGWGYMMLTNFLPNSGNGTFTIHIVATDREGHSVTLGSKTITCDNLHATLPFGTIDTPEQGGMTSGSSYVNFGWALTPQPGEVPKNGSTIWVWVDGAPVGHPTYDQYRPDIATLFPGYANSDGAVGFFYLNPSTLTEGAHTIAWSVEDSLGRLDGIGSRYFSVSHDESSSHLGTPQTREDLSLAKPPPKGAVEHTSGGAHSGTARRAPTLGLAGGGGAEGIGAGFVGATRASPSAEICQSIQDNIAVDTPIPLCVRRGFAGAEETVYPDRDGLVVITAKAGEPLAICLDPDQTDLEGGHVGPPLHRVPSTIGFSGIERVGADIRPLPIGARLDPQTGVFTWLPGPGFAGAFTLEFLVNRGGSSLSLHRVRVTLR